MARSGTARITEDVLLGPPPVFSTQWDPDNVLDVEEGEEPPGAREVVDRFDRQDLEHEIRWACARAAVVVVRLVAGGPEREFSAGAVDPPGWRLPRWPPSPQQWADIARERDNLAERLRADGVI